jgi:hypothetical protein
MWKFLKYWAGLSVLANMPFVAPFAGALHAMFGKGTHGRDGAPRTPQKPPRVLVTSTGPADVGSMDWKRIYKRVTGHKTEVSVRKVGPQEYAVTPTDSYDRSIRVSPPTQEIPPPEGDKRQRNRRRGMQR